MTAPRDPDRMIRAFLFEGEEQLHDQVYDAIRAEIEQKRQRAVVGPWRLPIMNKLLPIGLGAAAVVGVLLLGSRLLLPPSGPGGPSIEPSPSPTPSVTAPSATSRLSTPEPPPPLTETFTSERNGFSISYPAGWVAQPATAPWTTGLPDCASPTAGDILSDPVRGCDLWIAVASQPLGDSTPDQWVAETLALDDSACARTEPNAVDGATGRIGADGCTRAAVTTGGRGYHVWLYTGGDDPVILARYDLAWFEEVLATVQLLPEDAVDAVSSASP